MQKSPQRSVSGIVLNNQNNAVLLIKRRDVPIWVLPGGGVDQGETPEEAVIREVQEETGLIVKVKRHVALYTPINKLARDTYLFECSFTSGELTTGDETQQLGFFPFHDLPTPFFFIHQEWINDAQKQLTFPIHRPLKNVTYFQVFKYFLQHPLHVLRFLLSRLGVPFNSYDR